MRVLPLLGVLMLYSCATGGVTGSPRVTESSVVDERIGKFPNIGERATAPVGGVLYSQFQYWSKTAYRVQSPLSIGLGLGRIAVSDGDPIVKAEVGGESVY
jgi:hypothetical protein